MSSKTDSNKLGNARASIRFHTDGTCSVEATGKQEAVSRILKVADLWVKPRQRTITIDKQTLIEEFPIADVRFQYREEARQDGRHRRGLGRT